MQVAVRAGGFSALVVVGMAVIGVAILYAVFYVWLEVDSTGPTKVTDCKWCICLPLFITMKLVILNCKGYEFISISCHCKLGGKLIYS